MSNESKSPTVQIVIAIIGLVGVIGAALIANWDKLTGPGRGAKPASSSLSAGPTAAQATWQQQGSYGGDCRNRPAGTVCAGFEDGYVWLVRGAISGWEKRVEGGQAIQVAIASTGRYEHILGTNNVRVVR
jgi:hypothetical protein